MVLAGIGDGRTRRALARAWRLPPGASFQLLYVLNAVFLFNLFSVQLSGDLIQNRTYWGAFGLAWLIVSVEATHMTAAPHLRRGICLPGP